VDGSLARTRKQITAWGTFYDPVADKLLIGASVLLIVMQYINVYFGLLMLALELTIAACGIVRRRRGTIASANVWGKTKMWLQVLGVTLLLIAVASGIQLFIPFSFATLSLAIVFAVISLYTYSL
jgi:CDP-diacylglycerol--glycerol-3-phosphate 3-phosphatidyltransferase